jgi:hypothetical protein
MEVGGRKIERRKIVANDLSAFDFSAKAIMNRKAIMEDSLCLLWQKHMYVAVCSHSSRWWFCFSLVM